MSRVAVIACLLATALFLVAGPASAATQITFAQGYSGVNANLRTIGVAPRNYIQIWHQASAEWCGYYSSSSDPNGSHPLGLYCATGNPTYDPLGDSYAYAWAWNYNDGTGVIWTTQTTQ
jgi:hypothetical protein